MFSCLSQICQIEGSFYELLFRRACILRSFVVSGLESIVSVFVYCSAIGGLQPIPGDPKDNGVAVLMDDRTFCFVIQHGRHAIVILHLQGLVANHLLVCQPIL